MLLRSQLVGEVVCDCSASPWRGKHLVILNPNAGGGANIYQEFVRPMLKSAGVDVRVVRTTKPGDATALCAALRSRKFYVAESSAASTSCSASAATACSTRH